MIFTGNIENIEAEKKFRFVGALIAGYDIRKQNVSGMCCLRRAKIENCGK